MLLIVCITLLYDPGLTYADLAYLAVLFHISPYTLYHRRTTATVAMDVSTTEATTANTPVLAGTPTDTTVSGNNISPKTNKNFDVQNKTSSSDSASANSKSSYDSIVTSAIIAITLSIAGCPVLTILWLKTGGANANYLFFAGMMVWLCCGFIVAKLYRITTTAAEGSER